MLHHYTFALIWKYNTIRKPSDFKFQIVILHKFQSFFLIHLNGFYNIKLLQCSLKVILTPRDPWFDFRYFFH